MGYLDPEQTFNTFFPYCDEELNKSKLYKSGSIKTSFVKKYLETCIAMLSAGNQLQIQSIAQVFLFYALGNLFFPNSNSSIPVGWFSYLGDLDILRSWDWGSAILGRIYYALDKNSRKKVKSMDCFWQFIEFFLYEYTHTCNPVLRNPSADFFPRINKWGSSERVPSQVGILRGNVLTSRQQLEMRSESSILWTPYAASAYNADETVHAALLFSLQRVLLWDPVLGGTWFLGDRCFRQLTGRIAIPFDPPSPMASIPKDAFAQIRVNGWIPADQCCMEGTQAQWDEYWAGNSSGPIIPPLFRGVNTDGIGYANLAPPHIKLPCPPPPDNNPSVYSTQSSSQSSSGRLRHFDWTVEVGGSGGATITMELPKPDRSSCPPADTHTLEEWRDLYMDARDFAKTTSAKLLHETTIREGMIEFLMSERPNFRVPNFASQSGETSIPHRHSTSQVYENPEFQNLWRRLQ